MKKIILFLLALGAISYAVELNGSFTTGFYTGTPYWNSDNTQEEIDAKDSFMRTFNKLRLSSKFGQHFKIKLSALRSDGFQSENRLNETKFYQFYGQYDFNGGHVKVGRFVPFNRWIWGSVDGGAASYAFTKDMKLTVMGGMHIPYGLIYDSDHSETVVYSDFAMKFGKYGAKLKVFNGDDVTKVGADAHGNLGKLRFTGSYGLDVKNMRVSDAGLGLVYYYNKNLSLVGNYRLFGFLPGKFAYYEFGNRLSERVLGGASYRLFKSFTVNARAMVTMTPDKKDYLSYLTFGHKYFTLGMSYLSGDSDIERMGIIAAANYSFFKGFKVSAGVAPVSYLLENEDDHFVSIAYYLRADYRFLSNMCLRTYFNYFQFDDEQTLLPQESSARGGLQLTYFFGS